MILTGFDHNIVLVVFWLVVFLLAIFIELMTSDLVSVWFGGSSIITMILACFKVHWAIQLGVFLIVAALLLYLTRPIVKKRLSGKDSRTNADSLIGSEIIITKDISLYSPGEGKVRDITWTCKVENDIVISANEIAIIKQIKGNHLIVEKKGK